MEKSTIRTVNFTIGKGFGKILTDIALEKIKYNKDLMGAISVIEDSLPGISRNQVIFILQGIYTIDVDVKEQVCVINTETKKEDLQLWQQYCRDEYHKILRDFSGFERAWVYLRGFLTRVYTHGVNINLNNEDVRTYLLEDNVDNAISNMYDNLRKGVQDAGDELHVYRTTVQWAKKLGVRAAKLGLLVRTMGNVGILDKDDKLIEFICHTLYTRTQYVSNKLKSIGSKEILEEVARVETYIEDEIRLDKELSTGIKPLELKQYVTDVYTAYWISPKGEVYALKGDIANMLHYKMAYAILEKTEVRDISNDEGNDYYRRLEAEGYAKISSNMLLHDSKLPFTEEQQRVCGDIITGINLNAKKNVRIGLNDVFITGSRFKSMDLLQVRKLLNFEA